MGSTSLMTQFFNILHIMRHVISRVVSFKNFILVFGTMLFSILWKRKAFYFKLNIILYANMYLHAVHLLDSALSKTIAAICLYQ